MCAIRHSPAIGCEPKKATAWPTWYPLEYELEDCCGAGGVVVAESLWLVGYSHGAISDLGRASDEAISSENKYKLN